jgi:hypothetical protein
MKIVICTPIHGDPKAKFLQSLADMIIHSMRHGLADLSYITYSGSALDTNRNALVDRALRLGADYTLWIDADHTFPPHTLRRLLEIGQPVVGVNFLRREDNPRSTAATEMDGNASLVRSTTALAEQGAVQRVARMGLGLCLIDMKIVGRLPKDAFPLFRFTKESSEDVHFFRSLAAAGIPACIDHRLSMECGHIHEQVLRFPE